MTILNIQGPNRQLTRLEIEKNCLLIDFIPSSNSQADLLAAVTKRDRFNFYISFFLSPFIESDICYENNNEFEAIKHEGFAVLLKFNRDVDFNIIYNLFNKENFSHAYFSEFFGEHCRDKIISECANYFCLHECAKKIAKENLIKKIVYSDANKHEDRFNLSILQYKNKDKKYINCNNYIKAGMRFFDKKSVKDDDETKLLCHSSLVLKQDNVFKDLNTEKCFVQQVSVQKQFKRPIKNYEEAFLKYIMNPLDGVSYPSLWQTHSLALLEKNIFKPQPILIYATLINQLKIRDQMQLLNLPKQNIYDDLFEIDSRFSSITDLEIEQAIEISEAIKSKRLI